MGKSSAYRKPLMGSVARLLVWPALALAAPAASAATAAQDPGPSCPRDAGPNLEGCPGHSAMGLLQVGTAQAKLQADPFRRRRTTQNRKSDLEWTRRRYQFPKGTSRRRYDLAEKLGDQVEKAGLYVYTDLGPGSCVLLDGSTPTVQAKGEVGLARCRELCDTSDACRGYERGRAPAPGKQRSCSLVESGPGPEGALKAANRDALTNATSWDAVSAARDAAIHCMAKDLKSLGSSTSTATTTLAAATPPALSVGAETTTTTTAAATTSASARATRRRRMWETSPTGETNNRRRWVQQGGRRRWRR